MMPLQPRGHSTVMSSNWGATTRFQLLICCFVSASFIRSHNVDYMGKVHGYISESACSRIKNACGAVCRQSQNISVARCSLRPDGFSSVSLVDHQCRDLACRQSPMHIGRRDNARNTEDRQHSPYSLQVSTSVHV